VFTLLCIFTVNYIAVETDRYTGHQYYRPIIDLLNNDLYANSNFTMIRDARYYRPIFDFEYRFQ